MPYNKFYKDVERARKDCGITEHVAWYRGISDGRYTLTPSLLRYRDRHPDTEKNLFAEFWTMNSDTQIIDDWQRLSYMQHYGAPTRLLDWTENLNVATYFAVAYAQAKGTSDPYIWVLNPFRLNRFYAGKDIIYDAVDQIGYSYYEAALQNNFPNKLPLALKPMWSNARIRAQSGAFTVHGSNEAPLETLVNREVAKRVPIAHAVVDIIRKKIAAEGANHFTILGGPDGLARHLTQQHLHRR